MKKYFRLFIWFVLINIIAACSFEQSKHEMKLHIENRDVGHLTKALIPADFIPQPLKIAAIGDSLTAGVGDTSNQGGYLHFLKGDLIKLKGVKTVEIFNHGVSGNRTDQLLKRLTQETVEKDIKKADLVIVTIGGNDLMKIMRDNFTNLQMDVFLKEEPNYEKRLSNIITTVKKLNPQSTVILVGLYNPFQHLFANIKELNEIVDKWNEIGQQVVSEFEQTYFAPIENIFSDGSIDLLYEDSFHPNNKGYSLIAKEIYATLSEVELTETNEWFVVKEDGNE
ncbi:SGNH/GDSL hydrolase family protein [Bacillus kwashiorkori]|uniref:SGNH/GDSL hydrolase family protein n=1 Tax=Bacillus kwashiorkori TaxID=1522318 RepID=UPI00078657C8|nr:SGNH/GDSL hydrolase family protein [Bacillus kwashiorkori]